MLDIDFGTRCLHRSCIPPKFITNTIGVVKAYTTRVRGGQFPTEQLNDIGTHLQEVGCEYGTTTGRRRCGWLDLVVLKHSSLINGYDKLNLTKLNVLDQLEDIKVDGKELNGSPADLDLLAKVQVEYTALPGWKVSIEHVTRYEDLPGTCRKHVEFIEQFLGVPIEWIGVPGRERMIRK